MHAGVVSARTKEHPGWVSVTRACSPCTMHALRLAHRPHSYSDAAEALKPNDYCNVAGLACTSMSFTLGPEIVDAELQVGGGRG